MEKQYKRTSRACPQHVKTAVANKLRGEHEANRNA